MIRYNQRDKEKNVNQIIPAAGEFPSLDANTSLLKSTDLDDEVIEGVKIELHGDVYLDRKQTTVIELFCDHSEEVYTPSQQFLLIFEVGEPRFISFRQATLRLDWRTKYACLSSSDNPSKDKDDSQSSPSTKHWGFLTWLIIMFKTLIFSTDNSVFMVIAAYVIYSAFLNYSRYGAGSGWDLLPHSDTLRDMFVPFPRRL